MLTVRHPKLADAGTWLELRCALWPEASSGEHREEIEQFFCGGFPREPWAVLLAESDDDGVLGLAELSIRPFAEGCRTRRVAYLEGWFVLPKARGRGVGRALVAAAEKWARAENCTEFASDTAPENEISFAAHVALGFADVGIVRCFRKEL